MATLERRHVEVDDKTGNIVAEVQGFFHDEPPPPFEEIESEARRRGHNLVRLAKRDESPDPERKRWNGTRFVNRPAT